MTCGIRWTRELANATVHRRWQCQYHTLIKNDGRADFSEDAGSGGRSLVCGTKIEFSGIQGVEMKLTRHFRGAVVALALSGMLSAQLAQAAGPQNSPIARQAQPVQSAIRDVALADAGAFRGQVLNDAGHAQASIPVALVRDGQEVTRTQTDGSGRFVVAGLSAGIYEVHTPFGTNVYRVWAPRTAPPSAISEIVITPGQSIVRGQMRGGQALSWLANPWVLAGIVAAAIAIPLALDDDDDAS
jgi:hypothetical protein